MAETEPTQLDFGDSPFVEPTSKHKRGGDIKFTPHIVYYIVFAAIIIICLFLIYEIYTNIKINGETYHQRRTHEYFNRLHGETFDDDAKQAIAYGEAIRNPRAIDHFRIGTAYLINANDAEQAVNHLREALNQIIEGEVDWKEAPFIINRIDDFKDRLVDFPNLDELPLQQAMEAEFNMRIGLTNQIKRAKPTLQADDPNFTQKLLLNKQDWQSDSQNVHDTAIYEELAQQLDQVMNENNLIPNIHTKNYDDVINWLKVRFKDDVTKRGKLDTVLKFLNNNYPIDAMPNKREQDIIVAVWRRAHDPANSARFEDIKEAIADAVCDCIEGTTAVCMAGRTSKIWQALARLDKNPEIGVLKSKQALRNEIYERSAKIVDDFIGVNGTASEALKEAYQNSENTEQVNELIECITQQIDQLRLDYIGLIPNDQLRLIIEECKAAI
jgi:hypothetical protein